MKAIRRCWKVIEKYHFVCCSVCAGYNTETCEFGEQANICIHTAEKKIEIQVK